MHSIMIYARRITRARIMDSMHTQQVARWRRHACVCMKNECELTGEASHHAVMLCIVFKLQLLE